MSTASVVTLAQMRTAAQSRIDMLNSTYVSNSEWAQFITNSYKELYDLLVSAYGDDYYVASPYAFTTDGTNARFSLPPDFYKLLGVDLNASGRWITLHPFPFAERNRNGASSSVPAGGQQLQLWYIPEPTNLVNDADTIDGISGWEEYVEIDAAIKAAGKEESDVSLLLSQKTSMYNRLTAMAEARDAGMPMTVADTMGRARSSGMRYRLVGNQIWLVQGAGALGAQNYDFSEDALDAGW